MKIDVSRLGPEAQRQVLSKMLVVKARESKYGSRKAVRMMPNGTLRRFDSQKEARRYDELTARLRAGMIRDLRLQHTFTLQEGYVNSDGGDLMIGVVDEDTVRSAVDSYTDAPCRPMIYQPAECSLAQVMDLSRAIAGLDFPDRTTAHTLPDQGWRGGGN